MGNPAPRASQPPGDDLAALAARKAEELRRHLHKPAWSWTMRGNPVRRKALNRICDYLQRLQWLLDESRAGRTARDPNAEEWIRAALDRIGDVRYLGLETAWEIQDDLRIALLRVADDAYIFLRLQLEQKENDSAAATAITWKSLFPEADVATLIADYDPASGKFKTDSRRREAVSKLEAVFDAERHAFRHERARAGQLGVYFTVLAVVVLALSVVIFSLIWCCSPTGARLPWVVPVVVLLAGSLGSVLSLMLKFRDKLRRITELINAWKLWLAQLVLGAAMAMLVYFVFRTGLVTIGNLEPDTTELIPLSLLGFAAGFSEPFFLRAIEKVTQ